MVQYPPLERHRAVHEYVAARRNGNHMRSVLFKFYLHQRYIK